MLHLIAAVDLVDDPRWLGLTPDYAVVLVDPRIDQRAEQLPVVAESLDALFGQILDAEGALFFDAPGFTAETSLYDHMRYTDIFPRFSRP